MEKMTFFEISEKMYEVQKALDECVDEETGEIISDKYDELMQTYTELDMAEQDKTEGVCLMIKDQQMLVDALNEERKRIVARINTLKNSIARTKKFVDEFVLKGRKFETAKVKCSYRKSKAVQIADESIVPKEYMTEKVTVAPDKMAIKAALNDGETVAGCNLVENNTLSIK